MIFVIADDITGAAEIAGLAHCYGLDARLMLDLGQQCPRGDVVVMATDTRSMTRQEAVDHTCGVVRCLLQRCPRSDGKHCSLFLKTDSALRGHPIAEIDAILSLTTYDKAVFLPANPSKGRVITGGVYYWDGVPLSETAFALDPEFPAKTSSMTSRFPDAQEKGVVMPDAMTADDIKSVVEGCGTTTLLAGAADLFEALLIARGHHRCVNQASLSLEPQGSVFVCGSTQSRPLQIPAKECGMPKEVYDGDDDATSWEKSILEIYRSGRSVMLTIPHRHLTGKAVAVRLRETMAHVVASLVAVKKPHQLVIEGGATAFSCLNALSWREFTIADAYAPGVIRMVTPQMVDVILKPGSYRWPL